MTKVTYFIHLWISINEDGCKSTTKIKPDIFLMKAQNTNTQWLPYKMETPTKHLTLWKVHAIRFGSS